MTHASVEAAAARLDTWLEAQDFAGWDPHDGLNSPFISTVTMGRRWPRILALQLVKRSPLNLRPWLGVKKGHNPKGMGLFLASYVRKYRRTGSEPDLVRVRRFAAWLDAHASPGYHGACWGYNFDWANRSFFAKAGTPTLVNTSFNGLALLDTALLPEVPDRAALVARSEVLAAGACEFMLRDLWSDRPAPDELRFSYTPHDRLAVHNANALGASLLAAVAARRSDGRLAEAALAAARFIVRRQRSDGSWPYSEERGYEWIDNLHTGYLLVALKRVARELGTTEFADAIARGYDFWTREMFLPDRTPKYYATAVYPIDTHAVAQAILTFLAFADCDRAARGRAWDLADWAVARLQDRSGAFHFQVQRRYRIRIPYIRWTQAWMQRALAELLGSSHDDLD